MSDLNSKKVKEILNNFFSKKKDHSFSFEAFPDFSDWKFTPIFAHTSEEPVSMNLDSVLYNQYAGLSVYNYLVYLIKKNETFFATMKTYMISEGEEIPFALDEQAFYKNEKDRIIRFVSAPSRLFNIKNTHKRIITFENTKMTEQDFERTVKKWRKEPPTSS